VFVGIPVLAAHILKFYRRALLEVLTVHIQEPYLSHLSVQRKWETVWPNTMVPLALLEPAYLTRPSPKLIVPLGERAREPQGDVIAVIITLLQREAVDRSHGEPPCR
jgi:hypothetical protein